MPACRVPPALLVWVKRGGFLVAAEQLWVKWRIVGAKRYAARDGMEFGGSSHDQGQPALKLGLFASGRVYVRVGAGGRC